MTEAQLVADGVTLRTLTFKYDPFGRRVQKLVQGLAPQVPVPLTTWLVRPDRVDKVMGRK